jgi:hypothetical protein
VVSPASSQLLLNSLLQTGAAAAGTLLGAPATAPGAEEAGTITTTSIGSSSSSAAVGSSGDWQQNALAVARQLLCPDAAAAGWSPSWQCQTAAHALLATAVGSATHAETAAGVVDAAAGGSSEGSSEGFSAALTLQDSWKLSQAAGVLEQFCKACTDLGTCTPDDAGVAGGAGPQLCDAAVFEFLHAMAQVQSVLQVRPADVASFMRQHRNGGKRSGCVSELAACASTGLGPAMFALKQLSSSILLPADMLAPLAKTCMELWVANATAALQPADSQQQQQPQEQEPALQAAASMAVQGMAGLLFSSDPQLRMHAAAAWKQACCSSGSGSDSGSSRSSSTHQGLQCAVFVGVAKVLLQQQQPCIQLLPAYQAVAEVAPHLLTSAAAEGQTQASSSGLQAVASVVKLLAQQAIAQSQQQVESDASAGTQHRVQPTTSECTLLQLLLLSHILAHPWQLQHQQQQHDDTKKPSQQQQQQGAAHSSTAEATAAKHRPPPLCKQLLPQQLLGPLSISLLATLQALVPLLQQQEGREGPAGVGQQLQGAYTVAAGDGAQQAGPGGFPNYQALLSPPAGVAVWGVSASCCTALWGMQGGSSSSGVASSSSSSSSVADWLLDPYHQGDQQGTRLLQGLPLQLTAAVVDLAHTLLRYGLLQAVGRMPASHLLLSSSSSQEGAGAGAWAGVLCHVMDVKALLPIRRLAKQLLVDLAGSSTRYKEVRSVHLLSKHTSALLHVLLPPQLQQTQQGWQGTVQGSLAAPGVLGVVRAGVAALQGSWRQQCAAAAALANILSVADSQPVAWAEVCSSSSSIGFSGGSSGCDVAAASAGPASLDGVPVLLPLLLQLAMDCRPAQLCVTAVKLFNAALSGLVKASSSTSSSSSTSKSSNKSKPGSKAAAATSAGQQQAKPGSGGDKGLEIAAAGSSSGCGKEAAVSKLQLDLSWLLLPQQQQQEGSSSCTHLLSAFIERCVVGWPEAKERKEAAKTLVLLHRALGVMCSTAGQAAVLQAVLQAVPAAGPAAGTGSLQLFNAANQLLKSTGQGSGPVSVPTDAGPSPHVQPQAQQPHQRQSVGVDSEQQQQQLWQVVGNTAGELFTTAAAAAAALAAHPCGLAYQQLQELLEFQPPTSSSSSGGGTVGYWLELSGCDVVNGRLERKPPSGAVRLDSITAELKYGDKQVGCLV